MLPVIEWVRRNWAALAVLLAVVAAAVAASYAEQYVMTANLAKQTLKRVGAEQKETNRRNQVSAKVDASAAATETKTEATYRVINKQVTRYVQAPTTPDTRLDPEWVRLYNAAANGRDPADSTGAVHAASGAAAAAQ